MDLFTAVDTRASYRGQYKSDPVPREDLKRILKAGLAAPSGCNAQTTSFVAIDERATIDEIEKVMNKPSFTSAPAAICVFTRAVPVYAGNLYNVQDYAAAIENMLLAITALGYASCWVEGYVTMGDVGDRIASILGAPQDAKMVCYLPVGVPEEDFKQLKKMPFESRAWFSAYGARKEE